MCNSCAIVFIYYWASELVYFQYLKSERQQKWILQHNIAKNIP